MRRDGIVERSMCEWKRGRNGILKTHKTKAGRGSFIAAGLFENN
jgi:hypothetical protein